MNISGSGSYEVGPNPPQTQNIHDCQVRTHYMTQTERSFDPTALANGPGPSWSSSSGSSYNLSSIQAGTPFFHVQQEPNSPSSGGFPAPTPSQSLSVALSDCSIGCFEGAKENFCLSETGSSSDWICRRGFPATFRTPSTSGSPKEDRNPDIVIDDASGQEVASTSIRCCYKDRRLW